METEQRENYLEPMEDPESVDMVRLLAFPEDTAGGIMTSEFTTLPMGFTAGEALNYLRQSTLAQERDTLLCACHRCGGQAPAWCPPRIVMQTMMRPLTRSGNRADYGRPLWSRSRWLDSLRATICSRYGCR